MFTITVPASELWDEEKEEYISTKEQTLQLEHSLVSLSKWESKWHKPYLAKNNKTDEEIMDYIRCMTITNNVDPNVYNVMTAKNFDQISEYINDPMTATVINDTKKGGKSREILTAEIIYYSMIALNIPFECQKWHLNKLITLINVCNIKNQPPKKMGKRDIMSRNAALNAARRRQFNSNG